QRLHTGVVHNRPLQRPDASQRPALGMASRFVVWPSRLRGIVRVVAALEPSDRKRCARFACWYPLACDSLHKGAETGMTDADLENKMARTIHETRRRFLKSQKEGRIMLVFEPIKT